MRQTWENGEKSNSEPHFGPFGPNLSPSKILMAKNLFWAWFRPVGPQFEPLFFLKNLALSVTRYYGQLSSFTISEKTKDPILRKFNDGKTDRQTDRQTKENDFIRSCPTKPVRQFMLKSSIKNTEIDITQNN